MREIEKLKEAILKEYPRLDENSTFKFRCHKGVPCFNECCGDVNIFLTPYDIVRLKNRLGIKSEEFLKKYTITPFDKNLKYPVLLLKMEDDDKKSCPFVTADGCSVYTDRPWACRMYPLGQASPGEGAEGINKPFYFLLREAVCKGFEEDNLMTVGEWLRDQGIIEYNEMGEFFKDLTLHRFFQKGGVLIPEKMEMFFMVCYNIDRFRDFLFGSSFFAKFEVAPNEQKKLKEDDVELLKFGYAWLRFALFGEKTLKVKEQVLNVKKKELEKKQKK